MIVNGQALLEAAPIKDMLDSKHRAHGVSYGLAEAGYDIRISQNITFWPDLRSFDRVCPISGKEDDIWGGKGNFCIASAIEEFQMPENLVGVVHDKSTWARRGLSVFNTVIEPGWKGFLTLELVYHGQEPLHIPAGAGIAQVLFSRVEQSASYNGKYQNQADRPVAAIHEGD